MVFEAGSEVEHLDISYTAGDTIASIAISDIENTNTLEGSEDFLSILLQLESGNQAITIEAFGINGVLLSERDLTINVDPLEHWITVTSPSDYSIVENPVHFVINMSQYIQ